MSAIPSNSVTPYGIIVMGTSLGGLNAMQTVLAAFPADFAVPIVIVQHRSRNSGDALGAILRRFTALNVREPDDKEPIGEGTVYIAPPDYHLLIDRGAFALSTDAPIHFARPSIDMLFETAADAYGQRTVAVVLTGANHDGTDGSACIKAAGGHLVVEDPRAAEMASMPAAVLARTSVDKVLPLPEIGPYLVQLCGGKQVAAS